MEIIYYIVKIITDLNCIIIIIIIIIIYDFVIANLIIINLKIS